MPDELIRFCSTEDEIAQERLCKWPDNDVPLAVIAVPPGLTEAQFEGVFGWVAEQINAACGAKLYQIETARLARVLPGTRKIDGPSGVLAESQLPCGNVIQCLQWYDGGEHWEVNWPPVDRQKINLNLVALHEVMHALGIPHAPQNMDAVIAPYYNADLRGLRPYDVAELRRRYGPPRVIPTPVPTPTPPAPAPTPTPGGSIMGWLVILKTLLPFARIIAARTATPIDDMIVDVLGKLLDAFPAASSKADIARILREHADQVESP